MNDLVDKTLFSTQDDASKPASGIYYVSGNNWAGSAGTLFTDWYSNTASGYRNTTNIYGN